MRRRSRNRTIIFPVLLVLAAPVTVRAQESAPLLPLAEAVRFALANNERVLSSREGIEQARLGANLAESAFGTKITPNVLGSFGQSDVRNQTYGVGASRRFTTGTEVRMGRRRGDLPQPARELLCSGYDTTGQSVAPPGLRADRRPPTARTGGLPGGERGAAVSVDGAAARD